MINSPFYFTDYLLWLLIMIPSLLWLRKKYTIAINAGAAAIVAWALSLLIKNIFFFPRPFPRLLLDGSFPSSHTTLSFAIAVSIFLYSKKLGLFCLALAFLVAWGRVYELFHFPRDVFAGAILGIVTAILIKKLTIRD